MLIANEVKIPDECPKDCSFKKDIEHFGQNSICIRCPVLNCREFEMEGQMTSLLRPEDYRLDWAKEWKKFFDKEIDFPKLCLFERTDAE